MLPAGSFSLQDFLGRNHDNSGLPLIFKKYVDDFYQGGGGAGEAEMDVLGLPSNIIIPAAVAA